MNSCANSGAYRPQNVRKSNNRAILELLCSKPEITIGEITEETGLSRTAAQNNLAQMCEKGLVYITGKGEVSSVGGKKPVLYALNPTYQYCIHLFMCADYTTAEVYDFCLSRIDYIIERTEDRSYPAALRAAARAVRALMTAHQLTGESLFGITVAISGTIDESLRILLRPMVDVEATHWPENLNIVEDLEEKLGFQVPIYLDNLCRFGGYSQLLHEPGSQAHSFFYLMAHEHGVGGAFISRKQLLHGAHGLVGEVGHITVDYHSKARCRCGRYGCFETLLYGQSVVQKAVEALEKWPDAGLEKNDINAVHDLLSAADKGNAFARSQLDELAQPFAALLCNIQVTYDPEMIILSGTYTSGCTYFREKLSQCAQEEAARGIPHKLRLHFELDTSAQNVSRGPAYFCRQQYFAQESIAQMDF